MGKSGGKKKKGGSNQVSGDIRHGNANGGAHLDIEINLRRANELKEEGNRRYQIKDFVGALEQYDSALQIMPKTHRDRAVFHSNKAACLMQMKPINYETVIAECNMALSFDPRSVRALLRRARACEFIGRYETAMKDVQVLLEANPNHGDALEIAQRLRVALRPHQDSQQNLPSRPSPAALGASAVRGAPVSGLGPPLPARSVPKKPTASSGIVGSSTNGNTEKPQTVEDGSGSRTSFPELVLKPPKPAVKQDSYNSSGSLISSLHGKAPEVPIRLRQLKLVYDHDIRLSQMPVNCSFKVLREIVNQRFPSSKAVLIKYKDNDGDLVTITSTSELRLAESSLDDLVLKDPEKESYGMLRLHVVEVSAEQEPPLLEEEEEKPLESDEIKGDETGSHSSQNEAVVEPVDTEIDSGKEASKDKSGGVEVVDGKEVEMDDWLFEFAQLFRTHIGIDPDAHFDLHEVGLEMCSEALEETVTSEEAQGLFDKAASKFQEVAALAFFNWGNVYMCAARKRIPLDDPTGKDVAATQLQVAYDWVKEKYTMAKAKYEEAILMKPDFYEGLLALGQQQFEMAKLQWSFALASKVDLSSWDPAETLKLFDYAEEKMKAATAMWEKLEEERAKELKDPSASMKEEMSRRRKKQGSGIEGEVSGMKSQSELSADEAAEQTAVTRSQIHLFWGNMLFERSQIECKLGFDGWKKNVDVAVERFRLAGASEADISAVLKNHCSNEDAVKVDGDKVASLNNDATLESNDKNEVSQV